MARPTIVPAILALAIAGCATSETGDSPQAGRTGDSPLAPLEVPVTRTVDHEDDYHGTRVSDPYRWLEDADDPEVRAWVETQNRSTFGWLEKVPEREALRARLTDLWDFERFGVPRKEGGRLFYTRNDGLQNQSVLLVEDRPGAAARVLLDPNTLSKDGTTALVQWEPSDDGRRLAYGLARAGSDWTEWHVLDVESGKDLPDVLRWSKFSGCSWADDGSGFWYSRYDAPREGDEYDGVLENQKLSFHRIGTDQKDDALVYARPDHPRWGFGAVLTEDGRRLVLHVWEGSQPENRVYVKDMPSGEVRPLLDAADASWEFLDSVGDELLLQTNKDAPRGRILAVDARDSSKRREIVPEAAETLQSATSVGGRIIAVYMKDARSLVRIHRMDGALERELPLPGTGSASGFGGHGKDEECWFVYTDFFTPPAIYRCEPATGKVEPFRTPKLKFDPAAYETEQVFYASGDGTRVPMFVARRKGLPRDGDRPVLLYGYGGFNVSLTPWFSTQNLVWMERGGVFAVANIRGGGEYGEAWHKSAVLGNRPKAHDDFIAAGEWLCANGWTNPKRLAIQGGSNGGLLVGACLVRRPDLYGAAIPAMGVLDMLRYHKFTIGWAWAADYGTSDDADQFRYLLAYSPLQNVKPGAAYPPTLVLTADTDDRVVPAHSYKFAAALQKAQGGKAPILLRVDVRSGHGMGAPTSMLIARATDQLAFLVQALGAR
jgi:prolyl oligopeptidase